MISIIICTFNPTEEYLNRTVEAIISQIDYSKIEFFIVDNNSKRPLTSYQIVERFKIPVFVEIKSGLTAARECAVKHAQGDILVFVDDDNIVCHNYFELIDEVFKNSSIGVISGTINPEYEVRPPKWFRPFSNMLALRSFNENRLFISNIPIYNEYFPIGAGMCIRKKILISYFSSLTNATRIEGRQGSKLSSGEDIDIDLFAINEGYLIGILPSLVVTHIIPSNRCKIQYLQRLAESSLISCYQINKKWKSIFHLNVFEYFDTSQMMMIIQFILHLILYPLKRYRIGFIHFKTLIKLYYQV